MAEQHGDAFGAETRVHLTDRETAGVEAVCLHHGPYRTTIASTTGGYLDLATLYRNVVKELALTQHTS
ncbi:hypothetical protein [Streptomyces sp. NPDC048282]|uniref:hypothetical protein n=1 Tax=Streptomyces sp. NPDC048282 TaxID=3365528 RepID=UPI00370FD18F